MFDLFNVRLPKTFEWQLYLSYL